MSEADFASLLNKCFDNRYILIKKIGRGSFGVVFEIQHKIDNKRLAAKYVKNKGRNEYSEEHDLELPAEVL